ncbi:MAG: hypothetical protein Q8P18_11045 [Pseudomonadota bacterium]|nr:hypothetical protein [Pseudomonadota bacterium]
MSRQMTLALLLHLLAAHAAAAVPVRLPAQERVADWQEALTIAGLAVGVPGEGPWVDVSAGPTAWTVRVRDLDGVVHVTPVAPPLSEQDREDVAMLAASLLQPVAVPSPVKAPVKVMAPVRTPPPVVPPPVPVPEPEPVPPAPVPVPEPAPAPVVAPARATFQPRVGLAVELRPWSTPTGIVWAELQRVADTPLRPSLGGSLAAPADLPQIAGDVRYWSGEVWVGAWYAAPSPIRFDFGATLGVAGRSFSKDGEPVGLAWIPVFSSRVEVPLQVAPGLVIEPGVHMQLDARQIHLASIQNDTSNRFGDWSARVGIALRPVPRKPPKS